MVYSAKEGQAAVDGDGVNTPVSAVASPDNVIVAAGSPLLGD